MSRTGVVIFVFIALIFSGACKGKAPAPKPEPSKTVQAAAPQETEVKGPKVEDEVFLYERNKKDPFVSLVAKVEKPVKGETPLESYDISNMKVLGIVWTEKGSFAEIILPDGKAYTLNEGMSVGLNKGRIQKITRGSIIIKEHVKDYRGEMKPKETILKLREEEE